MVKEVPGSSMATETDKKISQYDPGLVLKSAHQDENQALRVTSANTSVPPKYSRVDLTYNGSNSVTNATFYKGTLAEIRHIEFVSDVGGSLNNTYFTLSSEYDESLYHVWYNVGGAGVDPSPAGSVGIEVAIETNDPAEIVALATRLAVDYIEDFQATELSPTKIRIDNSRKGTATSTIDNGTGFQIQTIQEGEEKLLKSVDVPFENNVIYLFNEQEKKFEVVLPTDVTINDVNVDLDAADGDNVAISRHQNWREILMEDDFLPGDLDENAYTNIFTYTATEDLWVRVIKVKTDTFGIIRLKVNGVLKDYFRVSNFERNCRFFFIEDLQVLNGQDVEIDFVPERIQNVALYNFFARFEGYVD